jgi:hypothetical protein
MAYNQLFWGFLFQFDVRINRFDLLVIPLFFFSIIIFLLIPGLMCSAAAEFE